MAGLPESMARWMASVSSATPSPNAPNSSTFAQLAKLDSCRIRGESSTGSRSECAGLPVSVESVEPDTYSSTWSGSTTV